MPSLSRFYKRASNGFKYLGPKVFCFWFVWEFLHSGNMAVVSTQVCIAMCFLQECSHSIWWCSPMNRHTVIQTSLEPSLYLPVQDFTQQPAWQTTGGQEGPWREWDDGWTGRVHKAPSTSLCSTVDVLWEVSFHHDQNLWFLLSQASAKSGRKQWHARVDCLTSGTFVFSLPGRASTHRVLSFVIEWRANRKPWRPARCNPGSSQLSLCTAAGLILFIFNQLCKISTSYQYSFISPKRWFSGFLWQLIHSVN